MKLKEIPENTVVHTPTVEEANELWTILLENGYKWRGEEEFVITFYGDNICYCLKSSKRVTFSEKDYFIRHNGYTILTLAEFKEKYVVEEKYQFLTGDLVRVVNLPAPDFNNREGGEYVKVKSPGHDGWREFYQDFIESFAGENKMKTLCESLPEAQKIIDDNFFDLIDDNMEAKGKEQSETGNNSENSQLNLCELLRGHEGDVLYSLIAGKCRLKEIKEGAGLPICIILDACASCEYLTKDGKIFNVSDARCILFPSRALYEQYPLDPYTAWMKWQEEQKKYALAIVWNCPDREHSEYIKYINFRTPSDRDKCIEEIKAIIEKYSK